VATRNSPSIVQTLVIRGLIIGYFYAIVLSASSIAVCETKRPGECSEAWNQGFATATGFVTTFLAYLIPPNTTSTTSRRDDTNAS